MKAIYYKRLKFIGFTFSFIILVRGSMLASPPNRDQKRAIARVNESIISEKDLDERINLTINQMYFHRNLSPEKEKEVKEKSLELLIEEELFYQAAVKQEIKVKKETIENELKKVIMRFKSKSDYKKALKTSGYTEKEFKNKLERELLIKAFYQKKVQDKTILSNEDLEAYYTKNKERFMKPESVDLQHIFIMVQDQTSNETWIKAEQTAANILDQLKQGEDFADLAAQYSDGRYSIKGGRLGWVHRGRLLPEIERIAFNLNIGNLSGVIKSTQGYHIIKLIDKQPSQQVPFLEVKDQLHKDLKERLEAEIKQKLLDDLKKKAKIEIYEVF